MRFRLLLSIVLVVVGFAIPASALGDNSQNYPDSIGENPNAPDITSVNVSNDDSGMVTFKINISNRPALTQDMLILIFVDTDGNPATGDPQSLGADYAIQLVPGDVGLFKWNGTDFVAAPSQATLTYSYDNTGATIQIGTQDLGGTKTINFAVLAASGITTDASGNPDFTNEQDDLAPDAGHGLWSYKVLEKLTVAVTNFSTTPKPAKSGKSFSASLAATESDTNGPVTTGTVGCAATLGVKRIAAASHRVANGIATCVWKLPKTAKGKTLRGTVTLTVQGVSVKHSFSAKIT